MNDPANSSDEELVDSLSDSDDHAIAALVERHALSLYDFALRATLDPEVSEEITRTTFEYLRANAQQRPPETSVRAWLFGFALERVLEAASDRSRGAGVKLSSGDRRFTQADPDIDREAALWAWQAARSLRPRDYCVLDLTVRRGLNPEELSGSAAQGRGGVYSVLGRASGAFNEAYIATALYFRGRDACNDLSELVGGSGAAMRVGIRRQIAAHVEDCETCQSTLETLPNAQDVFKALREVEPPPELPEQVLAAAAAAPLAAGQLSLDDAAEPAGDAEAGDAEAEASSEADEAGQPEEPQDGETPEEPVTEEALWAPPEAEGEPQFAGAGAADLSETVSELEERFGVEPPLPPYEPAEVYEQYGTEYAEEPYEGGYTPAGLTLSERLGIWFAPAYGRSFVLSYALLGVSTAIAIYVGLAVADSLNGGGGDSGSAALQQGQVREIACESGPLSMQHGSVEVFNFDPGPLHGFELDSVTVVDRPAAADTGALMVETQGTMALQAAAAPVFSRTARSDQYQLQIIWQRNGEDAVTDCDILVSVPASTGPEPTPTPGASSTPGADETPAADETPEAEATP